MNKVILMGRLTRDPQVTATASGSTFARMNLAVDRRYKREGEPEADFLGCVLFGKQAEFAEKYLVKGTKVVLSGRIQTGSYTNKEGQKVYTTDIVVEEIEFAESKKASSQEAAPAPASTGEFMNIPDGLDDEDALPFN